MRRARGGVARQIDHHLGSQLRDPPAELTPRLFRLAIDHYLRNLTPRLVRLVGLPRPARNANHLMPGLRQHWRKVCSNMPGTTDYYDSHSKGPSARSVSD